MAWPKRRKTTPKTKASDAMSRYVRLRDAIEYCKKMDIDLSQFNEPEDIIVKCCTCGKVKSWLYMQGGHFKGRGRGGGSGVYFMVENVHAQCGNCNAFEGGKPKEYTEFMIEKYGQEIVGEIELKHHLPLKEDFVLIRMYFEQEYINLLAEHWPYPTD